MKKLILLITVGLMPLLMSAEFQTLTFKTASGTEQTVGAKNLEMTVSDGNLEIKSESSSLTLALADLVSMQFTGNNTTAAEQIASAEDCSVTVYSLSGVTCGEFESLQSAMNSLEKGIYVAKQSDGLTVKIIVK